MRTLVGILAILLAPAVAFAHGAGAFYETTVDNYIIDVGFSTPAPQEEESVIFDFQLRNVGTDLVSGTDVTFTSAWVRIEAAEGTVFASGIHNAQFGGPRMSYVFPEAGDYTITVRYEHNEDALVETSFPMTVTPTTSGLLSPQNLLYFLTGIGGLVIGAWGSQIILAKRKRVVQ